MILGQPKESERVTVLMYHRIGDAQNDWERRFCISPERFAGHMRALQRRGMRPCSVEEFVGWLEGVGSLPKGSFLLTFDDGFVGVYDYAFPLLLKLRWPATVFLVSQLIGQKDEWTAHENPSGMTYPLLRRQEIEEMARGGISFQSHTRSHPDLRRLTWPDLINELAGARQDLEDLLGRRVPYFAYPYGWYNDNVLGAVKASGYAAAFSARPGFNRLGVDRYLIRRLDVYGSDTVSVLLRKMALGINDGTWWNSAKYYGNRVMARFI